jgi:nicotinamidase-related amidase
MNNTYEGSPTATAEISQNGHLSPYFSQGFISEIRQIGIKDIKSRIEQIPSQTNNHTAVVTSDITTQQGKFSGIGAANPESVNGSTSPQDLIDKAGKESIVRSIGVAAIVAASVIDVTPIVQDKHQKQHGHNPNKPMSQKQQQALESIARQHGTTLQNAAREYINKPVEKLSSFDANNLIQKLKNENIFG